MPLFDAAQTPRPPDCMLTSSGFDPRSSTMTQQDVYIAKMKSQLDELNADMTALELKAKEARADARDKYAEEMGKLREQSRLAGVQLDQMKAAAEGSWDQMVSEMEKLRNAFTSSFHYFKSQL
jgi:high-affinity K+ transport system ATPase subunit B